MYCRLNHRRAALVAVVTMCVMRVSCRLGRCGRGNVGACWKQNQVGYTADNAFASAGKAGTKSPATVSACHHTSTAIDAKPRETATQRVR